MNPSSIKKVFIHVWSSKFNYFLKTFKNINLIKVKFHKMMIYFKAKANKFIIAESRLNKNKKLSPLKEIILWIRFKKQNLI